MRAIELTEKIKTKGLELGFSHIGITPCHDFASYADKTASRPDYQRFVDNPNSFYAGCFPSVYFPQGKSIVCATFGFGNIDYPEKLLKHIGRIYLARCYVPTPKSIAGRRVTAMREFLEELGATVYNGPVELPARPAAIEAGIVRYGGNNFVYTEEDGSFVVIYTWLIDIELSYDKPQPTKPCPNNCRRCINACPTAAIAEPTRLIPPRCVLLNNLTYPVTPETAYLIGERIHGCDACQEACPRNHLVLNSPKRKDPFLEKIAEEFDLRKILLLNSFEDDYFQRVLQPIMYNYIRDIDVFRRNAAIAMENSGDITYIPALRKAAEAFADRPSGIAAAHALEKLEALEQNVLDN